MSFIDFAALKARVPIESVIPLLNLELQPSGEALRGRCVRCGGDERAFVMTPAKQAFYCFTSRKGGDVIALIAHVNKLSMKEAAQFLVETLAPDLGNSTVPTDGNSTSYGNSTSTGFGNSTVPEQAGVPFEPLSYLKTDHEALSNLGLSPATCEYFGAGYAPKGILRGRLAIPIHTAGGRLVAYCGRAVKEDQSPVLTFPRDFDPTHHVFNLHRITVGELYCVDDPLDVLLAFENGVENAIAVLARRPRNVVAFPTPNSA